jgi:hypothetical protein
MKWEQVNHSFKNKILCSSTRKIHLLLFIVLSTIHLSLFDLRLLRWLSLGWRLFLWGRSLRSLFMRWRWLLRRRTHWIRSQYIVDRVINVVFLSILEVRVNILCSLVSTTTTSLVTIIVIGTLMRCRTRCIALLLRVRVTRHASSLRVLSHVSAKLPRHSSLALDSCQKSDSTKCCC